MIPRSRSKKGFTQYDLEIFKFDYEIIDKLLVFHIGKFKFPLGIERFVEAGTFNKLIDRPLPSIRIIPGTYSDIGGMFHGIVPLPYDTKLKYEIAVTNGLEGPEPKDVQQLWDNNRNKAIGGRLGYECLPGLEIGGSYSRGKYDEDNELDIDFLGADIQYKEGTWKYAESISPAMWNRKQYMAAITPGMVITSRHPTNIHLIWII